MVSIVSSLKYVSKIYRTFFLNKSLKTYFEKHLIFFLLKITLFDKIIL